jgi:hypothetical protein
LRNAYIEKYAQNAAVPAMATKTRELACARYRRRGPGTCGNPVGTISAVTLQDRDIGAPTTFLFQILDDEWGDGVVASFFTSVHVKIATTLKAEMRVVAVVTL